VNLSVFVSWWQDFYLFRLKKYNLNIADYKLGFESIKGGPELIPSARFMGFVCSENNPDILIRVHPGNFMIPSDAKIVFNAPYVEELNGLRLNKNDDFWSILRFRDDLFIRIIFPHTGEKREAVLKFSLAETKWDLWPGQDVKETNPMEYPLDGLILYYLTVIHGDILIHASGACHNGRGYLFSGVSGKGKTTIAQLWDNHGAKIIHDDRLIVRKQDKGFFMFNTPVYNNDKPLESRLDRIFIIDHGSGNEIIPVSGAECVSLIMANCIQHNWDHDIIARLLDSVSTMTESIPAAKLFFLPDKSIIEFIIENE
jgi:hypothetical protein